MSFFKKDYSAYPQPVIVTPDPRFVRESISDAVAEPITPTRHTHTTQQDNDPTSTQGAPSGTTIETTSAVDASLRHVQDMHKQHQPSDADTRDDDDSQQSATYNSQQQQQQPQHQQQKDSTRLADGIMSLLGPIVQEMDFNIVSVRKSQTELEKEIERLMAELQLFMASSAAPPEVEPAVQKLVKARRQIMTANSTLKAVQERVDRMHLQIERKQ